MRQKNNIGYGVEEGFFVWNFSRRYRKPYIYSAKDNRFEMSK